MDQSQPGDDSTTHVDLVLDRRPCKIAGNPSDAYFQTVATHAAQMTRFGAIATAVTAPNGTILDVGANIGLSVIAFASQVPRGKVVAFEPAPTAVFYLRQNVQANTIGNVEVVAKAVGAHDGVLWFHQPSTFSAGSQVLSRSSRVGR